MARTLGNWRKGRKERISAKTQHLAPPPPPHLQLRWLSVSHTRNRELETKTVRRKLNKMFHISRETRAGNNLYQELSFQDTDALADIDEGADLTGNG